MNGSSVLVVEDEALILLDIQSALEEAGFLVVAANSAALAIEAFDADPTSFKALMSDIVEGLYVFDPAAISSPATYEDPEQDPVGVVAVYRATRA